LHAHAGDKTETRKDRNKRQTENVWDREKQQRKREKVMGGRKEEKCKMESGRQVER
jgi:hypothetical protein